MRLIDIATALLVLVALAGTLFFVVLAFSAHTPLQEDTLAYLQEGRGELPYSSAATEHMRDVRGVLDGARILVVAALLLALLLLSWSTDGLHLAGIVALVLPAVAAVVSWDALFSGMHAVLFPQGNWRFAADSLLIQTYPQSYFQGFAVAWGVLVMGAGLFLVILGRSVRRD